MIGRTVIVSHADADGHIIAEQTRRNLQSISATEIKVVVDPARTQNHKVWLRLDALPEIEGADSVFFMDLMFGHETFAAESACLVDYARSKPNTRFFLVDHHPFPLRRLEAAKNIRAIYRPDVAHVSLGPRCGMMVAAAICEHQRRDVAPYCTSLHDEVALGVRRAAALGGNLPGLQLLTLLRHNCWSSLIDIAREDRIKHPLPRGRRPKALAPTRAMKDAAEMAQALLAGQPAPTPSKTDARSGTMAYDTSQLSTPFDAPVGPPPANRARSGKDKEALLTLLEVAALSLTDTPESTFTLEDLIREARQLGGEQVPIDPRDAMNVLEKAKFVKSVGGGRLRFF